MKDKKNSTCGKNIIAERVKELREAMGLSQRELARKLQLCGCDMEKGMVTNIELGKRRVTDMELKAFVEVFGVDYAYLLDGDNKAVKEEVI